MYLHNSHSITYLLLASNILSFTSGHVFAFGESRALAIANMVLGLKEIQIRGEIRTNVDYTIDLLNVNYSHNDKLLYKKCLESRSDISTIFDLRLQTTEKTRFTQDGWTVESQCGLEQRGLPGIFPLLEGHSM